MPYLTEERRMIQEQAREFTLNEVLPVANKLDPEKGDIPMDLRDKMAELGYFGILIPEEYGGLGLGCFEYCLVTEELSRGWMSVASLIARGNLLIGSHMMSEEQKRRYLPRMAQGRISRRLLACPSPTPARTSPTSPAAPSSDGDELGDHRQQVLVHLRRRRRLHDRHRAHVGRAARQAPPRASRCSSSRRSAASCRRAAAARRSPRSATSAGRPGSSPSTTAACRPTNLIGEEGKAFYFATAGLETARAHTAARAIGLAQGALDDSVAYASERRQFGSPIADFQAIRFKIAEHGDRDRGGAPAHVLRLRADRHRPALRQGGLDGQAVRLRDGRARHERGLQIHGGAGYTTLHAVERHWRDARLTKIFEGTSEIQMRIISDRLLGRGRN